MKFLLQRVSEASVHIIDTNQTNSIGKGFLVYLGISVADLEEDWRAKVDRFIRRVGKYDLFQKPSPSAPLLPKESGLPSVAPGEGSRKSASLLDIQGELLIISNFTLYGRNKKSGSIDFCHAAPYDQAEEVYNYLIEELSKTNIPFKTGEFGAMMEVTSVNSGPVNILLEW